MFTTEPSLTGSSIDLRFMDNSSNIYNRMAAFALTDDDKEKLKSDGIIEMPDGNEPNKELKLSLPVKRLVGVEQGMKLIGTTSIPAFYNFCRTRGIKHKKHGKYSRSEIINANYKKPFIHRNKSHILMN